MKKAGKKRLGVLAGMGPRSTGPFLEMIYDECQKQYGAVNDLDYPEIVILSWPTPFYLDRKIDDDAMKNSIRTGLLCVEKAGASVIAMPCNSAHAYFDDLKNEINVKLLDIIDETIKLVPRSTKKITLIATATTIRCGLYQKGFAASGMIYSFREEWQKKIDRIISEIKDSEDRSSTMKLLDLLLDDIRTEGIDTVVVACTELAALGEILCSGMNIVDSAKALAAALVREYPD